MRIAVRSAHGPCRHPDRLRADPAALPGAAGRHAARGRPRSRGGRSGDRALGAWAHAGSGCRGRGAPVRAARHEPTGRARRAAGVRSLHARRATDSCAGGHDQGRLPRHACCGCGRRGGARGDDHGRGQRLRAPRTSLVDRAHGRERALSPCPGAGHACDLPQSGWPRWLRALGTARARGARDR